MVCVKDGLDAGRTLVSHKWHELPVLQLLLRELSMQLRGNQLVEVRVLGELINLVNQRISNLPKFMELV